jgi:hypothetical protein
MCPKPFIDVDFCVSNFRIVELFKCCQTEYQLFWPCTVYFSLSKHFIFTGTINLCINLYIYQTLNYPSYINIQ